MISFFVRSLARFDFVIYLYFLYFLFFLVVVFFLFLPTPRRKGQLTYNLWVSVIWFVLGPRSQWRGPRLANLTPTRRQKKAKNREKKKSKWAQRNKQTKVNLPWCTKLLVNSRPSVWAASWLLETKLKTKKRQNGPQILLLLVRFHFHFRPSNLDAQLTLKVDFRIVSASLRFFFLFFFCFGSILRFVVSISTGVLVFLPFKSSTYDQKTTATNLNTDTESVSYTCKKYVSFKKNTI